MDARSIKDLKTKVIGKKIYFYKEIGSTNDEASRLIKLGVGEGAVVISEAQTKGKGKPGRQWFSPRGGIYLSVIIEPFKAAGKSLQLTLLGTLAAARAINGLTTLKAKVKWPNDIVVSGKKIGGILTEAKSSRGNKTSFVVGIGLNAAPIGSDAPEDIREGATSLEDETGKKVSRTKIIKVILEEFEKLYFLLLAGQDEMIMNEWKILSETIGKQVSIMTHEGQIDGKAIGIGESGGLIIKTFGGRIKKLSSGEIIKQRGG